MDGRFPAYPRYAARTTPQITGARANPCASHLWANPHTSLYSSAWGPIDAGDPQCENHRPSAYVRERESSTTCPSVSTLPRRLRLRPRSRAPPPPSPAFDPVALVTLAIASVSTRSRSARPAQHVHRFPPFLPALDFTPAVEPTPRRLPRSRHAPSPLPASPRSPLPSPLVSHPTTLPQFDSFASAGLAQSLGRHATLRASMLDVRVRTRERPYPLGAHELGATRALP